MSEDVLSVIPADPYWQPERGVGERVAALVAGWEPDADHEVSWYDRVTAVDCGGNLERIGCPRCGGAIDTDWWGDLLEEHADGFATLDAAVPCCGAEVRLDALDHQWPCGFARFEIEVWNPEREWFTETELAHLGAALGHPVRQIRAHV